MATTMQVEQSHDSKPEAGAGVAPSETLYVRNLNEKLKKPKLKESLYSAFGAHGKVLDIVTLRRKGLRGQAWVIFNDVASATAAKEAMQGFKFFDKPLDIHFAKEKSDVINKRDNPAFEPNRKKRPRDDMDVEGDTSAKRVTNGDTNGNSLDVSQQVPTKMLLAKDLPSDCTAETLNGLFQQYQGFKEVRMVPSHNLAFVDFDNELNARPALVALNNFKLSDDAVLNLSFAKE